MKNKILFILICISFIFTQADINISYEMKYGDGKKITNVTSFNPDTSVYNYFENIMGINLVFNNGFYMYTQLEYSDPPILGLKVSQMNNLYFEYQVENSLVTIGDIYTLSGRGLLLNTFQDQNIDIDNSVRGLMFDYYYNDYVQINTLVGKGVYKFRSNPADEIAKRSLINSVLNLTVETDLNSFGIFQFSMLQKRIELDHLEIGNFVSDETLLGEDLNERFIENDLDFSNGDTLDYQTTNIGYSTYLGAFDIYVEKSWIKYDKILGESTSGSLVYGSIYADLDGFGLTYEYKNYNVPYYIFSIESAPTVFLDNPSILVTRNIHSMNYGDEIGHQIEIIGQVAKNINILANISMAYRHNGVGKHVTSDDYNNGNWETQSSEETTLPQANFIDIFSLNEDETTFSLFPYRQVYSEFNGWLLDDKMYFKFGLDSYDEVTKYHAQENYSYNSTSIGEYWWDIWEENYAPEWGIDSLSADNIFEITYGMPILDKINDELNLTDTMKVVEFNYSKTHAFTLPTQISLNPSDGYSLTMYLEQQWKTVDINKNKINGIGEIDNSTSQFEDYYYQYFSISLGLPSSSYIPAMNLTLFNDIENHKKYLGDEIYSDKTNSWKGYDITFRLSGATQFSIFYGSQKGGRVCANGVCADQPGFEDGFKLTYRSIF